MFKTLAASVLSVSIALTGLTPAPARAEGSDVQKWVIGAGLLAITAAAIREHQRDQEKDRKRDRKKAGERREREREIAWQREQDKRQKWKREEEKRYESWKRAEDKRRQQATRRDNARKQPPAVIRPLPDRRSDASRNRNHAPERMIEQRRDLPGSCVKTYKTRQGKSTVLRGDCLRGKGVNTRALPDRCERRIDRPGEVNDRTAWSRACLRDFGYRIR
ncbi:hypothetical protein [Tropicimonas sp.]|uniref:hypothetical protein n=1 Tax=Tropicimonas sp. TaxID=2067044 RepID=UPI003A8637F7